MKLRELKSLLAARPASFPRFILPNGEEIAAHFHITEVGHVAKRFIDCGGKLHERTDTCLLQTWVGDDTDHRLDSRTFARILDLGVQVLPGDDLEVEVEYDCCVVAQYPIARAELRGDLINFHLDEKHTDCLARRRREAETGCCGARQDSPELAEGTCC